MEKRFTAALLSAIGLHAALIGCAAFALSHAFDTGAPAPVAPQDSSEISVFVEDSDALGSTSASGETRPPSVSSALARVGPMVRGRTPGSASDGAPGGEPAESAVGDGTTEGSGEGDGTESPATAPRINLGLDGSVFNGAVLEAHRRPPPPRSRSRVVHDDWSAVAVQKVASRAAPREGSALITVEWDSEGRLQSVVTSAHSSDPNLWQGLADALQVSLSQRPKKADGRGLRLVYLVRSEIVLPSNQRSVLPRVKQGSLEQVPSFRDLPPGGALMLGVKADASTPGERVVSVTLANGQVL